MKDNVKNLENNLSHLESCWSQLEIHKADFEIRRWQSQDDNESEISPILGISDQRWAHIQAEVNQNLNDSYITSAKQLRNIVKQKVEYLSLLLF